MRSAHVNRLAALDGDAPFPAEFTDGVTTGLEVGLIELASFPKCGCEYEFALFTTKAGTLVWSWKRVAGSCASHA